MSSRIDYINTYFLTTYIYLNYLLFVRKNKPDKKIIDKSVTNLGF